MKNFKPFVIFLFVFIVFASICGASVKASNLSYQLKAGHVSYQHKVTDSVTISMRNGGMSFDTYKVYISSSFDNSFADYWQLNWMSWTDVKIPVGYYQIMLVSDLIDRDLRPSAIWYMGITSYYGDTTLLDVYIDSNMDITGSSDYYMPGY